MRVVVVGGGISGLSAAFLARAAGHAVTCLEPQEPAGGVMRSERHEGFLCEVGPQAVLSDAPDTSRLLATLGLDARASSAAPAAKRRFIFAHERLWPIPLSPPALLTSGLLSFGGKLRLLAEPLIRRRRGTTSSDEDDEETVAEFGNRRLGREASRVLLSTATIGIYAGDARTLSMASAFPRIAGLERTHGSLLRGMIATSRASRKAGHRPGHAISFPDGLGELPAALARALGDDLMRVRAVEVRRGTASSSAGVSRGAWQVISEGVPGSAARQTHEADHVILAASAVTTATLLRPVLKSAGAGAARSSASGGSADPLDVLTRARRAPIAIACLGFRDVTAEAMGMDLAAYGFLVARGETPRLLGCQYESSIFAGRAPEGGVLLRAILGGLGRGFEPEIVDQTDDAIAARALADLRRVTGLKREPDLVRVWRHHEGIPQYAPGHAARRAALDRALAEHRGLHVIGFTVRGVGVNECLHAATEVVARLTSPS